MLRSYTVNETKSVLTQLRKGVLEYCVLALLQHGPSYGVDLAKRLGQHTALFASEGTLYPLLSRLRRQGWVESSWQESTSGPPRRYYQLTDDGRAALATFVQPDQAAIGALAAEALRLVRRDENAENADPDGSPGPDALAVAACAALRDRRVMIKAVSDPWQAGSYPIRTASGLL